MENVFYCVFPPLNIFKSDCKENNNIYICMYVCIFTVFSLH